MTEKNNCFLIIDDDQTTALMLKDFLYKMGYDNVETCHSGKEGLKLFKKLSNSLKNPIVLLDFQLPDINSKDLMKRIFKIQPKAKIILENTEIESEEQMKYIVHEGSYEFVQKPLQLENLRNIINLLEQDNANLGEFTSYDLEKINSRLKSSHKISLARLSEYCNMKKDLLEKYMMQIEKDKKVTLAPDMKEISCNQCASVRILPNFFCPACHSVNFVRGRLLEHFKCNNISIEDSYKENKCPKCNKDLKMLGVDYRSLDNYYICSDCGDKFPYPSEDYTCTKCNNKFTIENANWVSSHGYIRNKIIAA
jgi:DNA-binding response OmpR family regulator/predicted RNA-binding Zn-ribbon protein involved in translation (DUF1610 family)